MKRPNLVNPQNWTPFKSVPVVPDPTIYPMQVIDPVEIQIQAPKPITRKEIIQRNSFWLNFFGMLIIFGIAYFLYSIYLERKIFAEYLNLVQSQDDSYPGFL